MSTYTTTMTQRSQVTVPSQVRRLLGLKPRDRIVFTVNDGIVSIAREQSKAAALSGSIRLKTQGRADLKDIIEDAGHQRADEIMAKADRIAAEAVEIAATSRR